MSSYALFGRAVCGACCEAVTFRACGRGKRTEHDETSARWIACLALEAHYREAGHPPIGPPRALVGLTI
jgi:hypothetical protein